MPCTLRTVHVELLHIFCKTSLKILEQNFMKMGKKKTSFILQATQITEFPQK